MRLPTLSKQSGRLARLGRDLPKEPTLTPRGGQIRTSGAPPAIVVIPPNQSQEEQWIWEYIIKRNRYWRQQQTFGNIKERGSTRVDFINDYYRAALYPEGLFVHRNRIAKDLVKYSLVRKRGYRVFVFYFTDLEYVKRNFPRYYSENFR